MSAAIVQPVFTIGHSNLEFAKFVASLKQHGIQALADVRSSPYGQYHPQFNRESTGTHWRREKRPRSLGINLFTIGFPQKSVREFFTALREAGVTRVVDVRLNYNSQLAGFQKKTTYPIS